MSLSDILLPLTQSRISYSQGDAQTDQLHFLLLDFARGISLPEVGLIYDEEVEVGEEGPVGGHPDWGLEYRDYATGVKTWAFDERWGEDTVKLFAEWYLAERDAEVDGRTVRLEEQA